MHSQFALDSFHWFVLVPQSNAEFVLNLRFLCFLEGSRHNSCHTTLAYNIYRPLFSLLILHRVN